MFWPIESSSGQIQNIVQFTPDVFNKKQNIELVHSVSAHNKGTHNVYKIILTLIVMFNSIPPDGTTARGGPWPPL